MSSLPIPSITWAILDRLLTQISQIFTIDIRFDQKEKNPYIKVVRDVALIRYELILNTHGLPKRYPHVTFSKIRGMGEIIKSIVSPSNFGEVNGSLRLRLYAHELPPSSEISLYVDFELRIDPASLVRKDFIGSEILDHAHSEVEVLCTNKCDYALEQVPIVVKKNENEQLTDVRVSIVDTRSHHIICDIDARVIKKADEFVKWHTSFQSNESILFKITGTWT